LPFEAKQQPPIGRTWVVDAIAISNQTAPVSAHIEQWVPVRAVARESRHIDGENDADLPKRDSGHHLLEAKAMRGIGSGHAQVGIDDFNILPPPPQIHSALLQRILQA
jgi:hypothetical protein